MPVTDRAWRADAACRDKPTSLWFTPDNGRGQSEETERALAICDGCPVRADCLNFALTTRQEEGLWGGLNPRERRIERRRRLRARRFAS